MNTNYAFIKLNKLGHFMKIGKSTQEGKKETLIINNYLNKVINKINNIFFKRTG